MIDSVNRRFEILQYNDKLSDTIDNLIDQVLLCIYPRLKIITYYCGDSLIGHTFKKYFIQK